MKRRLSRSLQCHVQACSFVVDCSVAPGFFGVQTALVLLELCLLTGMQMLHCLKSSNGGERSQK